MEENKVEYEKKLKREFLNLSKVVKMVVNCKFWSKCFGDKDWLFDGCWKSDV